MISIQTVCGIIYWINPRHIAQMQDREVNNWMHENYDDLIDGITHYTLIRTVHGREYDVNTTVEELLKVISPYLETVETMESK